jgi:hypothetical protein
MKAVQPFNALTKSTRDCSIGVVVRGWPCAWLGVHRHGALLAAYVQQNGRPCLDIKQRDTGAVTLFQQAPVRPFFSVEVRQWTPLRWLDGTAPIQKPEITAFRSAFTIADVYRATDADTHARAVERWARSTWEAYVALHPLARRWVEEALVGPYPAM